VRVVEFAEFVSFERFVEVVDGVVEHGMVPWKKVGLFYTKGAKRRVWGLVAYTLLYFKTISHTISL
jgi:hypothetical protein